VEDAVEQFEVARRHLGFDLPDNNQPYNPGNYQRIAPVWRGLPLVWKVPVRPTLG
jgi:hypothetical protein